MAKISPVSIKYMIHANFMAEGALEKPDVIGALFGQTEGLLGADLEMRDLQKEGKIGRIEVELKREGKQTTGTIKIPTALDQSETSLVAAAIETIERIGPCDSQIEVEKIEDVRGSKRDYILERAKKFMTSISGSSDSREISNAIKDSSRISDIKEYGEEKLPYGGDISNEELIVVEGRADVINLMRSGIKNAIGMNGTKLPSAIKELGKEKEITLFVDGDRGGRLIAQNVVDNANIKYIAIAPDGKEVEELGGKEVLMCLRKKVSAGDFFRKKQKEEIEKISEEVNLSEEEKEKLKTFSKENQGTEKALLLDESLEVLKEVSVKSAGATLKRTKGARAVVMDGTVTSFIMKNAEDAGVKIIVAKNFATSDTKIKLLSL